MRKSLRQRAEDLHNTSFLAPVRMMATKTMWKRKVNTTGKQRNQSYLATKELRLFMNCITVFAQVVARDFVLSFRKKYHQRSSLIDGSRTDF